MSAWTVPLSDLRFSDDEIEAVAATFRSGWLSQGPNVAAFETAFASYVGCRHAVAVASGTAALHLACVAIGLGPGDEVVLPSLTFAATAAAVHQTGATPVFTDIRAPTEPWLSVDAARAAIGPRTRAVVHVSYGGHPGEVLELRKLASEYGLVLLEDAAHGLGAVAGGIKVGAIGHVSAFSFFANKNLPLGEGGMLVTSDEELARRARSLRSHGLSADTWARHQATRGAYDVLEPGFNYRLDEPRAALGRLLLRRLDRDNERRRCLARSYAEALKSIHGVAGAIAQGPEPSNAWHIYPLLLEDIDSDVFRARLGVAGVQTSVHYPPLHLTRAFGRRGGRALPVTEDYARRTVTVPLFPHMSESQLAYVVDAIKEASH